MPFDEGELSGANKTPMLVSTIDCQYLGPEHAASYLLIEDGQAAFVENNTVHAVPLLMRALERHGMSPEQVAYAIITHLHLDHAGGTSSLVKQCPNATVLAHPRAVRHLVDPSRLIAGVKAVYGAGGFNAMYAPIEPIDQERVRGMEDGETVDLGRRMLTFLQTPGHAKHHVCIHDSRLNGVFTGDTFGYNYRPSRRSTRPFLLFPTAPTDFDPDAARESIRRILATGAERAYLTHFGELAAIEEGAEVVVASIERMEGIVRDATASGLAGGELQHFCEGRVREAYAAQAAFCGATLDQDDWRRFDGDIPVDAHGVAVLVEKAEAEPA